MPGRRIGLCRNGARNSVRRPHRRIGRARRCSAKKSLWIPSLFRPGRLRPLFRWRLCRSCPKGPGSLRGRALWRSRRNGAAIRWLLRPAATACRARRFGRSGPKSADNAIRQRPDARNIGRRRPTASGRNPGPKPWQRLRAHAAAGGSLSAPCAVPRYSQGFADGSDAETKEAAIFG